MIVRSQKPDAARSFAAKATSYWDYQKVIQLGCNFQELQIDRKFWYWITHAIASQSYLR